MAGDAGEIVRVLSEDRTGTFVPIYAQPRASRTEVVGVHDGMVKIALAAPPVDGTANKELVKFLAGRLGVRKSAVELVSGDRGRRKRVRVEGLTSDEVAKALAAD